jgi:hypothetical protein
MTDNEIQQLAKQHADDQKAFARAVERLAFERARDLCNHRAKMFNLAGGVAEAKAAIMLSKELNNLAHGKPIDKD